MTDQERKVFLDKYSGLAMEQQQRYGIPASVTLAQLAIESGWGTGRALTEGNNAFCVKAGSSWKGPVVIISDNAKNERFRQYGSISQSFEDHSKVLMGSAFKHCHGLSSTDAEGWARGMQSGRMTYSYNPKATSPLEYSEDLISIINKYHLKEYDARAEVTRTQPAGYMRGRSGTLVSAQQQAISVKSGGHFMFPLDSRDVPGDYAVSSDIGKRKLRTTGEHQMHHGIDIAVKEGSRVVATEDHGRVIQAGFDKKGGGNFVKIQYEREGKSYQVAYLHLSKIDVTVGQTVNAGTKLGLSGNTGSSTGAHLDFRVRTADLSQVQEASEKLKRGEITESQYVAMTNDQYKYIDPKSYLADVAVRGNITTSLLKGGKGQDLLAQQKDAARTSYETLLAHQQNRQESLDKPLVFNDAQLDNMSKAALLSQKLGSGKIEDLMGLGEDMQGDDIIASLLGIMLTTAVPLLSQMFGSDQQEDNGQGVTNTASVDEDQDKSDSLAVRRSRSVTTAANLSSVNFDANMKSENNKQNTGIRIA